MVGVASLTVIEGKGEGSTVVVVVGVRVIERKDTGRH